MAKHKLNRKALINYYTLDIYGMLDLRQVSEDLIKGSEFILTAEDVLQKVGYIEGMLCTPPIEGKVHFSDIKLIYR